MFRDDEGNDRPCGHDPQDEQFRISREEMKEIECQSPMDPVDLKCGGDDKCPNEKEYRMVPEGCKDLVRAHDPQDGQEQHDQKSRYREG